MINSETVYKLIINELRNIYNKPIRSVKDYNKFIKKYKYKKELMLLTGLINQSSIVNINEFINFAAKRLKYDFNIVNFLNKFNLLLNLYLENKNSFSNKSKKEKIIAGLENLWRFCKNYNVKSLEDFLINDCYQLLKNNYINLSLFLYLVKFLGTNRFKFLIDEGKINENLITYFETFKFDNEYLIHDLEFEKKINKILKEMFRKNDK